MLLSALSSRAAQRSACWPKRANNATTLACRATLSRGRWRLSSRRRHDCERGRERQRPPLAAQPGGGGQAGRRHHLRAVRIRLPSASCRVRYALVARMCMASTACTSRMAVNPPPPPPGMPRCRPMSVQPLMSHVHLDASLHNGPTLQSMPAHGRSAGTAPCVWFRDSAH